MVSTLQDLSRFQLAVSHATQNRNYDFVYRRENECHLIFEPSRVAHTFESYPSRIRRIIPISVVGFCQLQCLEWAKFHKEKFDLPLDYSYSFLRSSFFTSKGLINKEMAAKELVKDTQVSSSRRYCIACYYCFSDDIPDLYEQLPVHKRPQIDNGIYINRLGVEGNHWMVKIWSHYLLGEFELLAEENEFSYSKFMQSLYDDNDVAFKNCFLNLSEEEKEDAIFCNKFSLIRPHHYIYLYDNDAFLKCLSCVPFINMWIFLFGNSDLNHVNWSFREPKFLFSILYHLLSWPYGHLFMNTVEKFWEALSETEFYFLLHKMVRMMKDELSSEFCNYRHIFREFWVRSPSSLKRIFFRLECLNKPDLARLFIFDRYEDFIIEINDNEPKDHTNNVIYLLFKLFTVGGEFKEIIEIVEIIRLIFESATLEEQLGIVNFQGKEICNQALEHDNFQKIDLFIKCCVPKERSKSFKRKILNDVDREGYIFEVIACGKVDKLQKILKFIFENNNEIQEWKQSRSWLPHLVPENTLKYSLTQLKNIENSLGWSLLPGEIIELKKSLVVSVEDIAKHFKNSLLKGDFENIDFYLIWIFSSEIDIPIKKDIAFETISSMNYSFVSEGLNHVKNFVKWSNFSPEECKDFKRRFTFSKGVMESYCQLVAERQLDQVDTFIRWAELTESEIKGIKKRLVIDRFCTYSVVNASNFVKKLLNWIQCPKEDVREFLSNLAEKFDLTFHIIEKDTHIFYLEKFFCEFHLSEEVMKSFKKSLGLKSFQVFECCVENNYWSKLDELVNWCFSSREEISDFKKKFSSQAGFFCLRLIFWIQIRIVEQFFIWTEIDHDSKKKLLEYIIYDTRIYEKVAEVTEKNKNEITSLLQWISKNDISNKWNACFMKWCNEIQRCFCPYRDNLKYSLICPQCKGSKDSSIEIIQNIRNYQTTRYFPFS